MTNRINVRIMRYMNNHRPEHVFEEKARIGRLSHIREIVFGAQDGLLVPLGVISGVAGAFASNHIVIVAGIAEALAGAFSMATGAYLASGAERQVHQSEIDKEHAAIRRNPKEEQQEMVLFYEREGLNRADAEMVVQKLVTSDQAFFNAMIQKEFGLDPEPPNTPVSDALLVGASYAIAAVVPLFPYFFLPTGSAIFYSIALTLAALFCLGLLKARFASLPYIASGLQILIIGALSGFGGYVIGSVLPKLLGFE